MPLYLYYAPSFTRSLNHLSNEQRSTVALILEALTVYYASRCRLSNAQETASGFFYKQLRKLYYEAGVERKIRVIIRKDGERYIAMLAGNHDQIRQFLARS